MWVCLQKLPVKDKCLLGLCYWGGLRKAAWLRLQMHNFSHPMATFPSSPSPCLSAKQALFRVFIQNTSQTPSWDLSIRVSEGRKTCVLELFNLTWLVWQEQARGHVQKQLRQQTEGGGDLQQGRRNKRLKTISSSSNSLQGWQMVFLTGSNSDLNLNQYENIFRGAFQSPVQKW